MEKVSDKLDFIKYINKKNTDYVFDSFDFTIENTKKIFNRKIITSI